MFRAASEGAVGDPPGNTILRYVRDDNPGYSRRPYRNGFRFYSSAGTAIDDPGVVWRIQSLRIPPAWTDVWICPAANGHLQATGRDQRGRKQYLYHEQWMAQRSAIKYERLLEFAACLPRIRRRVARDFSRAGLPKEKVLATVLRLMESTLIRVGNEQYARENNSFGLTTLRDRHAHVHGDHIELKFRGKSGKWCQCDVCDARLARIVRRCQELPGQQLLQYLDHRGRVHDVSSADVNDYLHSITGRDFTAKDFRTWAATSLALSILCHSGEVRSVTAGKRKVVEVIDHVASRLNNTRSVCRKSYIHPGVIAAFLDQSLPRHFQQISRRVSRPPRDLLKHEHLTCLMLHALGKSGADSPPVVRRAQQSKIKKNVGAPQ